MFKFSKFIGKKLLRRINHTDYYSSIIRNDNIAAIILAGGKSDRMNFPKPFLPYDSDRTFIEKIVNEYEGFGCRKIVLVINEDLNCAPWDEILLNLLRDVLIVYNGHSDLGRFYSLHLGVNALENVDYCFIQNVDSPFIDSVLLKKLYDSKTHKGYIVPEYESKGGHPILVGREVIKSINEEKNISINLKDKLRQFDRKTVDSGSDKVLININTLEEYQNHFDSSIYQEVLKTVLPYNS